MAGVKKPVEYEEQLYLLVKVNPFMIHQFGGWIL
jgi:hypothetical protein